MSAPTGGGVGGGGVGSKRQAKSKKRREAQQEFTHSWMVGALKGHTAPVLDMDFSANGKFLASCAEGKPLIRLSLFRPPHTHITCAAPHCLVRTLLASSLFLFFFRLATASSFPASPADDERSRLSIANLVASPLRLPTRSRGFRRTR